MLCTVPEIAKLLGKSQETIRLWIKEGCPVAENAVQGKKGYRLDSREVVEWCTKRAVASATSFGDAMTKEEAQRRKLAAEAELAELEIAKRKGEVVDLKQMQHELSGKFTELRSAIRRIPERCALRLVGEMDEVVIKTTILDEIDMALEALADE